MNEPIFKSIFGSDWENLPMVMRRHYANRPFSDDEVVVEGILDVSCRGPMRLLRPFYRLLGTVPAVTERGVAVRVQFSSETDSRAFQFNRDFLFKHHKAYRFNSKMLQVEGCEVVEIMRFGICWRMNYRWQGGRVLLQHKGYGVMFFGRLLPLPLTFLLGRGDAVETPVSDDQFDMRVQITHPLFGLMYSYAGRFTVLGKA